MDFESMDYKFHGNKYNHDVKPARSYLGEAFRLR